MQKNILIIRLTKQKFVLSFGYRLTHRQNSIVVRFLVFYSHEYVDVDFDSTYFNNNHHYNIIYIIIF